MNPFKHKLGFSTRSNCASLVKSTANPAMRTRVHLAQCALAALFLLPASVMAADSSIMHEVVAGDTLISLASRYLGDADAWKTIRDDNNVKNPRQLIPGTELLIRLPARDVIVIFAHGDVTLIADDGQAPHTIEIGEKLPEGTKIRVGGNSYLSLQFADGSITRVMSDSVVQLVKIREQGKSLNRVIELERGAVDVSVTPQGDNDKRRKKNANTFEIMTPGAIAAVRGTRYDVTVSDTQNTTSSVTEGTVGIGSRHSAQPAQSMVPLSAGYGIPVDPSGNLGAVRPLLPPPDLAGLQTNAGNPLSVVLAWPDVSGAAAYQVRVSKDADMQQVERNKTVAAPTAQLMGLADGSYTIDIRAIDDEGILGTESQQTFEIKTSPAFPFLAQPTAEQVEDADVTFDCTPVVGASSYHLQVAQDAGFDSIVLDEDDMATCHFDASGLANGTYFWRVASVAVDANGDKTVGPFSNPGAFTVDATASTSETDSNTTVYWTGEFGQTYIAEISRDEQFSDLVRTQEVTQNALDLYGLPAGKYYIRLQAQSEGLPSKFHSAPRIFEVQPDKRIIQRTWADTVK